VDFTIILLPAPARSFPNSPSRFDYLMGSSAYDVLLAAVCTVWFYRKCCRYFGSWL